MAIAGIVGATSASHVATILSRRADSVDVAATVVEQAQIRGVLAGIASIGQGTNCHRDWR
jgi:hypothetical protein